MVTHEMVHKMSANLETVFNVRDALLASACTTDISKSTHPSPPAPDPITQFAALPIMGVALWFVWATYTTTEIPEAMAPAAVTLEVAVPASAPCTVVAPGNALPDCLVTVEGTCAELYTCPVNENVNELFLLPDASVMAESDHSELSVFVAPDATAAEPPEVVASAEEPPEVAASTAEPSEEAGVHIYELFVCPDEVMKNISESPIIPVSALKKQS